MDVRHPGINVYNQKIKVKSQTTTTPDWRYSAYNYSSYHNFIIITQVDGHGPMAIILAKTTITQSVMLFNFYMRQTKN